MRSGMIGRLVGAGFAALGGGGDFGSEQVRALAARVYAIGHAVT